MTHKQRILELLRDGRPHTHHELYALGCVAHSRISDLRSDGYTIDCWRDGDNSLYRLVGSLDEPDLTLASSPPSGDVSKAGSGSSSEPPNPEGASGVPDHLPVWDGGPLHVHPDQHALFEAA